VTRLRDVSARLDRALHNAGFQETSWFAVPEGFALVSRFEQFRGNNASPVVGPARWAVTAKPPSEGPSDYTRALFTANPGFYRVFVFIVTKYAFNQSDQQITFKEGTDWLNRGADALPNDIGEIEFSVRDGYKCTALVYEYQKLAGSAPTLVGQSVHQGQKHLEGSGIWRHLAR
jgi:hypothetical protein